METRKSKILLAITAVCLLGLVFFILGPRILPWRFFYADEIRAGSAIVENIDRYAQDNGRLPDPGNIDEMKQLGFTLLIGYRPAYAQTGKNDFEIEYFIGFDDPAIKYSSVDRRWFCELCD